jgi:hypothetical protein
MILEDTDQDGKADVSKVFVEDKDLVSPLGIAVIGDKVIRILFTQPDRLHRCRW